MFDHFTITTGKKGERLLPLITKKLFVTVCILWTFPAIAQNNKVRFAALGPLSLDSGTTWVQQAFDTSIGSDALVVGLGEVSHGGYEPLAFKAKMIQFLVLKKDYRNLLFEMSDVGSVRMLRLYLNDHEVKDLSVVDTLVERINIMPSGKAAFKGLFRWLKQYNLAHPEDMVKVNGFDLNVDAIFTSFFMYKYLIPYDAATAREWLHQWGRRPTSDSVKMALMTDWYQRHKVLLEKKLDQAEANYIDRQLLLNQQTLRYHTWRYRGEGGRASIYRDSIQARNVIALTGNKKTVVWGHNGHISTIAHCMGMYLKQHFGKRYYIVMTDYSDYAKVYVGKGGGTVEFVERYVQSSSRSFASLLANQHKISSGVFFRNDVTALQIGDLVNDIDNYGRHEVIGDGNIYNALVIFKAIHPN